MLFQAVELINNELPADYSETTVTIVVMDEDDQLPTFNQDIFHINVSENIGKIKNKKIFIRIELYSDVN